MSQHHFLTVGYIATICGVPVWKIRRLVDALDVDLQRITSNRLLPRVLPGIISLALKRQDCVPKQGGAAAS